jgi:tyrosinase
VAVIRRNIITDAASRDMYVRGVLLLKNEFQSTSGLSTYDALVVWHWRAMMTMTPTSQSSRNAAHRGPVFLPWHRYFLIVLEQQLQRVLNNSNFGLPYWPWHIDGDKPMAQQPTQPVWGANCMGGNGSPIVSGPFANPQAAANKFLVRVDTDASGNLRRVSRGLGRRLASQIGTLPTTQDVKHALSLSAYDEPDWNVASTTTFRNVVEGWSQPPAGLHNRVHVWVGGDMLPGSSPNDPVFFLNHCNEDRIWAAWQGKHGKSTYSPPQSTPAALRGHRPDDRLSSVFSSPPRVKDMFDITNIYAYDTLADMT